LAALDPTSAPLARVGVDVRFLPVSGIEQGREVMSPEHFRCTGRSSELIG
jgi:hypothetical protein